MKEGQDAIYYITADGFSAAKNSPHLEVFRKLGVEVLLMYDRVDEWVVSALTEFEGKTLQSVARGDLDLEKLGDKAETPDQEHQHGEYKDLLDRMHDVLKERASSVRVTHRLTDSPACLVSDEHGMSTNLERLLKASGQKVPSIKPVLEVNPRTSDRGASETRSRQRQVLRLEPHPLRSGDAGRRAVSSTTRRPS